jgi:tetratricopeptide (TPR) repeat protein
MYRHDLARLLVVEYLELQAGTDSAWSTQYGIAASTLKSIWCIHQSPEHPGCPSLEALFSNLPDHIELEQRQMNAKVALGRGDFDDAKNAYGPLISCDRPSPAAFKDRGGAFLKQGLFEDAVVDCEMAIELDERNPISHLRLIYALISLQRLADANRAYERALISCPNDNTLRDLAVVIGPNPESRRS